MRGGLRSPLPNFLFGLFHQCFKTPSVQVQLQHYSVVLLGSERGVRESPPAVVELLVPVT
jgi:hypothetical protein